ncbi:MAG TPA: hypothetical protein VJ462_04330 [Thermodesulfobacteriota bacterium]|nr:hypothetical protein [Thermodesulfobacteriota bacterium]
MEKVETLVEQVRTNIQDGKSDEEIFQSLQSLLGKDPTFDGHLAESLTTLSDAKTAKILQRMLKISKEKKVQKMIKRSLYRLKSKGISIEETPFNKEASILRPVQAERPKGMGGGFDTVGQRFLLLVIPHSGRGGTVMEGVISDTLGLVNFSGEEMTRKGVRIFVEEIQKNSPFPLVEMEASYVGFLFAQAYRSTLERKETVPQDYLRLKGEIENVKKEYERPLIYSYLPSDEVAGEDRQLGRGGDLLKVDLFSGWRIEEDLIRRYANEVGEAEESKIVLHPTQKEARFQGIYQKALSELFSGERRFLYKGRLEEMAYLLFKLGKEEEARLSLAVALDLEKSLNLIQPNPFLLQLIVKSIFTLLAEANEKRAKEPSLIVKP